MDSDGGARWQKDPRFLEEHGLQVKGPPSIEVDLRRRLALDTRAHKEASNGAGSSFSSSGDDVDAAVMQFRLEL